MNVKGGDKFDQEDFGMGEFGDDDTTDVENKDE